MGYVYILTNPSFREDWIKIGKTKNPVNLRSKELDNTAIPLPFEIYATIETDKYNELEQMIHKTFTRLTDTRIRNNREFYNMKPEEALDQIKDFCQLLDNYSIDCPDEDVDDQIKLKKKVTYKGKYTVKCDKMFYLYPFSDLYKGVMKVENHKERDKYILKEGSIIDENLYTNIENIKRMRERYKESLNGKYVIKDIEFDSPSGAADFVRGRAINGKIYWQTEEGQSIHDFIQYL